MCINQYAHFFFNLLPPKYYPYVHSYSEVRAPIVFTVWYVNYQAKDKQAKDKLVYFLGIEWNEMIAVLLQLPSDNHLQQCDMITNSWEFVQQ